MASAWIKGTRNLLNKDNITNVASGASDLYLENGKTYTISCIPKISNNSIWIDIRPASSGYTSCIPASRCFFEVAGRLYKTATIPDDGVQYCVGFCSGGGPNATQWASFFNGTYCENLMVNEGELIDYEPYHETTKISAWVRSRNLVDLDDLKAETPEGYYHLTYPNNYSKLFLTAGKTYNLSYNYVINSAVPVRETDTLGYGIVERYFDEESNSYKAEAAVYKKDYPDTSGKITQPFTANHNGQVYFWFIRWDYIGAADVDVSNVMLNEGEEALPYEPYGFQKLKMKVKKVV